jgi:arylformamidase
MSFDDMPDRGKLMLPGAQEYADRALESSKKVVASTRNLIDVAYGDDYWQKIDIFLPDDASVRDVPVLLFMHGGAWRHGFKEWMGFMAPQFIDLPAIFISVGYRLVPEAKYPKPLEDCFAALEWVYRNIMVHGGDKRRIFIGGHSAGAHLAALVALRKDLALARLMPKDVIKGCFPVSGALNLHLDEVEPGGRREKVIKLLLESADQDREASAIDHVEGSTTPFFLTWGSQDLPELIGHNRHMISLMQAQPCVFEYHEFEGANHFDTNEAAGDRDSLWVRKVRDWMVHTPSLVPA